MVLELRQRALICLRRCGIKSQRELAEVLNVSQSTVSKLWTETRATLLDMRSKAGTEAAREEIDGLLQL
jgi:DNA-directed RNA polymerase specialized sigma24 family protein